jgi:ketosteroid isomerase-like protein
LEGDSALFGPVKVSLDRELPSTGQVGKLSIPFFVQMGLEKAYGPLRKTSRGAMGTAGRSVQPQSPSTQQAARFKGGALEVYKVMENLWAAISRRDVKAMASLYSRTGRNLFFGTPGTGLKFNGAEPYMRAVANQFANVKNIKVTPNLDDLDIKVFGRSAVVTATGRNDVEDTAGKTGSSDWRSTVVLQQEGNAWLITHDHTSFDPNGAREMLDKASKCLARIRVNIEMNGLALKMRTEDPVLWYSEVTTIPPVGDTASVSAVPTRMIAEGRPVAVLESGAVRFREVVRQIPLEGTQWIAMSH